MVLEKVAFAGEMLEETRLLRVSREAVRRSEVVVRRREGLRGKRRGCCGGSWE